MDEKTGGRKKRKVLTQERVAVKPLVEIPVGPPHAVVGQSIARTDAQAKVTGKLAYAAD